MCIIALNNFFRTNIIYCEPCMFAQRSETIYPLHHWVTRPKYFIETDTETFLIPKFLRPIPRLFLRPNICETDTETFFETKYFWDLYQDFISRPNVFETDTETFFETKCFLDWYRDFFGDQIFFLEQYWDFFLDKIFRDHIFWDWYRDFFRPNFLRLETKIFFETNFFENEAFFETKFF